MAFPCIGLWLDGENTDKHEQLDPKQGVSWGFGASCVVDHLKIPPPTHTHRQYLLRGLWEKPWGAMKEHCSGLVWVQVEGHRPSLNPSEPVFPSLQ